MQTASLYGVMIWFSRWQRGEGEGRTLPYKRVLIFVLPAKKHGNFFLFFPSYPSLFETCRCPKMLYTNYWSTAPYLRVKGELFRRLSQHVYNHYYIIYTYYYNWIYSKFFCDKKLENSISAMDLHVNDKLRTDQSNG